MGSKKPDPPGTRYVGGKKLVPFQGPKPRKRAPGEESVRIGNYRADVDVSDDETARILGVRRKRKK